MKPIAAPANTTNGAGTLAIGIALVALVLAGLGVWLIRGSMRKS